MSQSTTPAAGPAQPPLVVNAQYIKDLSFEVPGAPQIYATLRTQPQVRIQFDVQLRKLPEGAGLYEVSLEIRVEAHESLNSDGQPPAGVKPVFLAELTYGGVFTLTGIPDNTIEPVLLVECPRLLFPYARNIIAEVTRDGGFPPVLLQPVDFVALWQARRAQGNVADQVPAGTA